MRRKPHIIFVLALALTIAFRYIALAQNNGDTTADTTVVTQSIATTPRALGYQEKVKQRLDNLCSSDITMTSQLGLMVYDLNTGTTLYSLGERQLLRPASTMKLLTAITALDILGKNYRYRTAIYAYGNTSDNAFIGNIYIKGMMDPTLDFYDIESLVNGILSLGVDTIKGNIVADRSFMDSPLMGEGWCWDDKNPVLSPLVYDRRDNLLDILREKIITSGITIIGNNAVGVMPRDATLLAERFTTLETVLMTMLKDSDNQYAESVFYNIGAFRHLPSTADNARLEEKTILRETGLNPDNYRIADGSGLSLYNYLSAQCEVYLLRYAFRNMNVYNTLLHSLPIAGVDGTLKNRMRGTAAEGNVHAKTGTLTGVSSLAGYCTSPEGHTIAFAILNQGVMKGSTARAFQDSVCQALCE